MTLGRDKVESGPTVRENLRDTNKDIHHGYASSAMCIGGLRVV